MSNFRKNSHGHDHALSALMGAIVVASMPQANGIAEASFAGDEEDFAVPGYDFGDADFGIGQLTSMLSNRFAANNPGLAGAISPTSPFSRPSIPAAASPDTGTMVQLWQNHQRRTSKTDQRASLLDPNGDSDIRVERYSFSLNANLVLATAVAINAFNSPDVTIRPQRVTMNAPGPGFVTVSEIKVANTSVTIGGTDDAWSYNANGVGQQLDMPTLTPANKATMLGNYTGFVPPGYVNGSAYVFCVGIKGPAAMTL